MTTTYKKKAIPQASRRAVALAAGALPGYTMPVWCELCGSKGWAFWPCRWKDGKPGAWVQFTDLEIDHIERECFGGSMDPSNLRLLCRTCNRRRPRLY